MKIQRTFRDPKLGRIKFYNTRKGSGTRKCSQYVFFPKDHKSQAISGINNRDFKHLVTFQLT